MEWGGMNFIYLFLFIVFFLLVNTFFLIYISKKTKKAHVFNLDIKNSFWIILA